MRQAIIELSGAALEAILNGERVAVIGRDGQPITSGIQIKRVWYKGEIAPIGVFLVHIEHDELWAVAEGAQIPTAQTMVSYD